MPKATYTSPSGTLYTASGSDQASALAKATANALKDKNSGVISASTLSSTEKPAPIAPLAPTANTSALGGLLGETATQNKDAYQTSLDTRAEQAQAGESNAFDAYLNSVLNTEGKTSLTAKEYAKTGVDQAEQDLNEITNQILAEQVSSRHAIENIYKSNPNGLGAEVLQAQAEQIQRDSISKQADLAVIQLAKQGKFDSAKEVADRAVQAKFEQQQIVTQALQLNYERNKDLFSKAEQRAFETAQADRNRALEFDMYKEKARYDQILSQSDPLYKLQLDRARKEIDLLGEPTAKEKKEQADALAEAEASIPVMQDKIAAVGVLAQHPGLDARVGSTPFTRAPQSAAGVIGRGLTPVVGIPSLISGITSTATGEGQDFAGGVHKLVGGLTLDNLIAAKARGATFGALSEGELSILASSATAINDWEIKDKNGKGTGFWDIDKKSFEKELETIKELTQRAITRSGGSLVNSDEQAQLDELFKQALPAGSYYPR